MHANIRRKIIAASLTLALASLATTALAGNAQPAIGVATNSQSVHVTLMLKLHNQAALESYIQQTVTPGSPHFQQFLSTSQFAQQYGATDAEIAQVQAYLKQQGLTSKVLANRMAIQTNGTPNQFSKAFQVPIHTYASRTAGQSFHSPAAPGVLPAALSGIVVHATGLNNEIKYRSHRTAALDLPGLTVAAATTALNKGSPNGNPAANRRPGQYTVADVANFYNINPLYQRGITGNGSTVAIVTLSDFYPADAQAYWDYVGLTTKPNRITQIHVDGGGAIDGGSGETALDVEQSGGLAPQANVLVYDAPNAGTGFTDAFLQAVLDNQADSISTSWGSPEIFSFAALNGGSSTDTTDVGDLVAFHQILMEAAVQGQSVFAASGDSGAYDAVRDLGVGTGPGDSPAPLTVDSPASDPYITAAGGTTTPVSFSVGGKPVLQITQESVWGWDYLQNLLVTLYGPGDYGLFSVGGGGGVSVYWPEPSYQWIANGIRTSEANQSLVYPDSPFGPLNLQLPSHFAGRNVPDVSLNADPETGYLVKSTYDNQKGFISEGGTSFVAPQLNGISALLTQSSGHRVGFWNPRIYLLQKIFGGSHSPPFNSVTAGDNWFYRGMFGYEQGAGIGTLNVANLDAFLKHGF
jgi:kumamolisin